MPHPYWRLRARRHRRGMPLTTNGLGLLLVLGALLLLAISQAAGAAPLQVG